MNLQESGKTLADVQLGSPDAEADKKLAAYFLKTPYVESALTLKRTLFLGRKGAGKSALFTQLPRLIKESGYQNVEVVQVTPDQYAWKALHDYQENGLLPEQAHSNAWKFTLAIEAASRLLTLDESKLKTADSQASHRVLHKFLKDNYGDVAPNMFKIAGRLLQGIKSFNISAFGFGAGLTRSTEDQPLTPQIIDFILDAISVISKDFGVVVALDKLDDSWEGSDRSKQLLIGLLKASKEINDKYKGESINDGFAVLVFLRADIYEGLQFDDKDKHRATEESINWTSELLLEMVQERLPKSVTVPEIFEPGEMRGSITPFNYIVKRTFLRPREVLQFLDECIRKASSKATQITKDNIRKAEERYSTWKVDDLKQEYRRLHPDFDQMVETLRQATNRYDTFEEFTTHLTQRVPHLVTKHGVRAIIELLFNSSSIGVRLGDAGSPRYRSEDNDFMLPAVGAIYVHQCLFKGMSVREKRVSVATASAASALASAALSTANTQTILASSKAISARANATKAESAAVRARAIATSARTISLTLTAKKSEDATAAEEAAAAAEEAAAIAAEVAQEAEELSKVAELAEKSAATSAVIAAEDALEAIEAEKLGTECGQDEEATALPLSLPMPDGSEQVTS